MRRMKSVMSGGRRGDTIERRAFILWKHEISSENNVKNIKGPSSTEFYASVTPPLRYVFSCASYNIVSCFGTRVI